MNIEVMFSGNVIARLISEYQVSRKGEILSIGLCAYVVREVQWIIDPIAATRSGYVNTKVEVYVSAYELHDGQTKGHDGPR